ncbi:LysR family transcriptional regulator [Spirochaetia bacterium]|nr:LysR family transcriptional regulator [Spirochaetia bacterium]
MEHHQLLNFLAVCEEKSFSRAAERVFISQQGLSKSIKQLETGLGVPLFLRSRQGIELTQFGEALEKAARSYINQHDHIVDDIRRLKDEGTSHLSIGMVVGTADILPPHFFKDFILDHPDISVDIQSFHDDDCLEAIREHKMHLGFFSAPVDPELFRPVYSMRHKIFLMTGKQHHLARFSSIKMKDLFGETIINLNNQTQTQTLLAALCAQYGVKQNILLGGAENNLVYELCSTQRIASFFARPIDEFPDLVRIDIEDLDMYWEFHLIVNKHAFISNAAEQFIAYTREKLRDHAL